MSAIKKMLDFMKESMPLTPKQSAAAKKMKTMVSVDSSPLWMRDDPYAEHGGFARWWLTEDQRYSVCRPGEVKHGRQEKEGRRRTTRWTQVSRVSQVR